MTTDNLKHNPGNWQDKHPKLFERIANLHVAFIKVKMDFERLQYKLRQLEGVLKATLADADNESGEPSEENCTYTFEKDELFALDNMHDAASELLMVTHGITARLVSHISLEEAKKILTLHTDIARIYNNYNYHLPSTKTFEQWLKQQIEKIRSERKL